MTTGIKIAAFTPLAKGALRGFCDVTLPSGMVLRGCSILAKDGQVWAWAPSKQMIGRDGAVLRTADGKARYEPTVSFVDRATQARWSAAVIEALRAVHPEELA